MWWFKGTLLEKGEEDWLERHLFQQKKQALQTLQPTSSSPSSSTSLVIPMTDDSKEGPPMWKGHAKGKDQGLGNVKVKAKVKAKVKITWKAKEKGKVPILPLIPRLDFPSRFIVNCVRKKVIMKINVGRNKEKKRRKSKKSLLKSNRTPLLLCKTRHQRKEKPKFCPLCKVKLLPSRWIAMGLR